MKCTFQFERASVLIEAMLALSLFTGILFTGWRVIQIAGVRTQMTKALSAFGETIVRDPDVSVNEYSCNKSNWNNSSCAVAKSLVESVGLPLCAVAVELKKNTTDDLGHVIKKEFVYEDSYNELSSTEKNDLNTAGAKFHYLTENQSDLFPDWFNGENSDGLGTDSSIRRKFMKFAIAYNASECSDVDIPKVSTSLEMIFPAQNAFENDPRGAR